MQSAFAEFVSATFLSAILIKRKAIKRLEDYDSARRVYFKSSDLPR